MIRLTSMARRAIGERDYAALEARCAQLGVEAGVLWNARHHRWRIVVKNRQQRVRFSAAGPLATALADALDDFERQFIYTPDELAQIQRQSA